MLIIARLTCTIMIKIILYLITSSASDYVEVTETPKVNTTDSCLKIASGTKQLIQRQLPYEDNF